MITVNSILIGLSPILAAAVVMAAYAGHQNLQGVCRDVGRPLTREEKEKSVTAYFYRQVAEANGGGQSELGWKVSFRQRERTGRSILSTGLTVVLLPVDGETTVGIKIYPNIPSYALDRHGNYEEVTTREKVSSVAWPPVSLRYRLTGYANDLVFADLKVQATTPEGIVVIQPIDWRLWINACGNPVDLPDEFSIG